MARQTGHIKLEGTVCGITFYRMDGVYYARAKSSLDKARVKRDPRFARSREAAARFGVAVKLASAVYRRLPAASKGHGVIGKMTASANKLLCAGYDREEALVLLEQEYFTPVKIEAQTTERIERKSEPKIVVPVGTNDYSPRSGSVIIVTYTDHTPVPKHGNNRPQSPATGPPGECITPTPPARQ